MANRIIVTFSQHVLTAAHCLTVRGYNLAMVRLGETDLLTSHDCLEAGLVCVCPTGCQFSSGEDCAREGGCAPSHVSFRVEAALVHPDFDRTARALYHDLGLLKLDRPVVFSDYVQPVCLPAPTKSNLG